MLRTQDMSTLRLMIDNKRYQYLKVLGQPGIQMLIVSSTTNTNLLLILTFILTRTKGLLVNGVH